MTAIDVPPDMRSHLRQFLIERFDLEELKNLCFDLSVDYEMFHHQTKGELTRDMLSYFERSQKLSCLVAEMVKVRPDDGLVAMLARLGGCSPRSKVQIVLPGDKLKNRKKLLRELAKVLGVAQSEVQLIAAAAGSIRVLVGMPAAEAERLVALNPDNLGEAYELLSVAAFDSLAAEAREAWREAALLGRSSTVALGLPAGTMALVIIASVLVVAATVLVVAAPRVTLTNQCDQEIHSSATFPVVGEVTFDLASGESRDYLIPPGNYDFNYDGEAIRARVPIVGAIGPYKTSGEINAFYENEPIMAGRPLRESIGFGANPEIVLCPSGR